MLKISINWGGGGGVHGVESLVHGTGIVKYERAFLQNHFFIWNYLLAHCYYVLMT